MIRTPFAVTMLGLALFSFGCEKREGENCSGICTDIFESCTADCEDNDEQCTVTCEDDNEICIGDCDADDDVQQ